MKKQKNPYDVFTVVVEGCENLVKEGKKTDEEIIDSAPKARIVLSDKDEIARCNAETKKYV